MKSTYFYNSLSVENAEFKWRGDFIALKEFVKDELNLNLWS
jgi:hypothetical protein